MAVRPVFIPKENYVSIEQVSFQWFPGFSPSQKKKSIDSIHQSSKERFQLKKILEVSTK